MQQKKWVGTCILKKLLINQNNKWVDNINTPTEWMIKTLKIED